jgi:hypothetical protein
MLTFCITHSGALAASPVFTFVAQQDIQLVHVSLVNSTANAGTLKIGNAADDDGYLAAKSFGVSLTPTSVATPAAWDGVLAGGQYPHVVKGTVIKATITDHGSHMADCYVVITATEG